MTPDYGLETKFARLGEAVEVTDGTRIEGYASYFGACDQGGDIVQSGAYGASLQALSAEGRSVKMLWQHDPAQPIGIWDEVHRLCCKSHRFGGSRARGVPFLNLVIRAVIRRLFCQ